MRRRRTIFALLAALLFSCDNQENKFNNMIQTKSSEEELIIRASEDFLTAWNNGDARAASEFFAEDGVRVDAFGAIQRGREEIEAAYDKLLHETMQGAKVKQERGTIRMLTPDLAIWQGGIEIILADSSTMKGYVVQIMQKQNGKWLNLEVHPKIFPPK